MVMHIKTSVLYILVIGIVYADGFSCDFNLVTGPYGVTDDAITASSHYNSQTCMPKRARTDSGSAWCPQTIYGDHFLQVQFRGISQLKIVITYARRSNPYQHAPMYKVNISMDGTSWSFLTDQAGNAKVFPGNAANLAAKVNVLDGNVVAKYIRIMPEGQTEYPSMRLEVKGCPVSSCTNVNTWKAKLGTSLDVLSAVINTTASNPGLCGGQCHRNPPCDSFLFEMSSNLCRLFTSSDVNAGSFVSLEGKWYFVKIGT